VDRLLNDKEILAGVNLQFRDIYQEVEHSDSPSEALERLVRGLPSKKPN